MGDVAGRLAPESQYALKYLDGRLKNLLLIQMKNGTNVEGKKGKNDKLKSGCFNKCPDFFKRKK